MAKRVIKTNYKNIRKSKVTIKNSTVTHKAVHIRADTVNITHNHYAETPKPQKESAGSGAARETVKSHKPVRSTANSGGGGFVGPLIAVVIICWIAASALADVDFEAAGAAAADVMAKFVVGVVFFIIGILALTYLLSVIGDWLPNPDEPKMPRYTRPKQKRETRKAIDAPSRSTLPSMSAAELPLETQQLMGVSRPPKLNGRYVHEKQPRETIVGLLLPTKRKRN